MLCAIDGGSARGRALRRLQLHQDGGEALRQRVVDVAGQAVALFEDGLSPRLGTALFGELALMERQRRLPRHCVEQRAMPGAIAERCPAGGQREPSEVTRRQHERCDEDGVDHCFRR